MSSLHRGALVQATTGTAGVRTYVVVSSTDYLTQVRDLTIVVPVTAHDLGWPNHVALSPTDAGWAMTERVTTLPRRDVRAVLGTVAPVALAEIDGWLRDFLAPA